MKKPCISRALAALLAALLLLGMSPVALAQELPSAPSVGEAALQSSLPDQPGEPDAPQEPAAAPTAQQVLEQSLEAYTSKAADWEELSALYAAAAGEDYAGGVDLSQVTLPEQAPMSPSAALLYALMTGDEEAASAAAVQLVVQGKLADPGHAYGYSSNLLAVEAYNRTAQTPLTYDRGDAVATLLGYRYEGGDGYGYTYEGVYVPDYDTAGLALAAFTLFTHEDCEGLEAACGALTVWLQAGVQRGIGNPNSLALVITGLTAAGADTDTCLEELLTYYLGEGKFESSYLPGEPDAFATKQAVRALAEALGGKSFFTSLVKNTYSGSGESCGESDGESGGESGGFVYITVTGPNGGSMLSRTKLPFSGDMTSLAALRQSGLSFTEESGYVSAIEEVKERDYGVGSGWLFKVNEVYGITRSASKYRLAQDDELVWYYTHDYGEDKGSSDWREEAAVTVVTPVALEQAREEIVAALLASLAKDGSSADDLALFSLARGGDASFELLRQYDERLVERLGASQGVLSSRKYTEYSKAVLTLTAAGFDPTNVGPALDPSSKDSARGYDLTAPLADFDKVTAQGVTGAAYALLALDCGNYKAQEYAALRSDYLDYLLSCQLDDGGFALTDNKAAAADPDTTAIVLQAIAPYERAGQAAQRALARLSAMQGQDGGFSSYGEPTCESVAQVVIALCQLGVSLEDARFVKEKGSLLDALLSYRLEDGSFSHTQGGEADAMATGQALMALTALSCEQRDASLFVTFYDIAQTGQHESVEALAAAGVLRGMGDGRFCPDASITSAQYYTALTRTKGLEPVAGKDTWYEGYLERALLNGLADEGQLQAPDAPLSAMGSRAQAADTLYEVFKTAA